MSKLLDNWKSIRENIAALRKQAKEESKKAFAECSTEVFDANPKLESFGWTQYTPHFADGDVCTFSAYTDEPNVNGEKYYKADLLPGLEKAEFRSLQDKCGEFLGNFETEDFEALFGDHAAITVTRKGVQVEEYDHD